MDLGTIIKNTIAILAILLVVFFSQQPYTRTYGQKIYTQGQSYYATGQDWVKTNVLPKVSGEVGKASVSTTQEVTKQKNNFVQILWEDFKLYFAQKFNKTFGTNVK
ncbi:MAG: hypothetical protein ACHQVK_05460 [Candidatus Paceibacterales bacterium]